MNKIFIAKEKHADRYFLFNTDEEKNRIALKLLKERVEIGYYSTLEDVERDEVKAIENAKAKLNKEYLELSGDEVEGLPESIRVKALEEKKRLEEVKIRVKNNWALEREFAELLDRLLKSSNPEAETYSTPQGRDYSLAWYLLDSRQDGEYEGIEIERGESY